MSDDLTTPGLLESARIVIRTKDGDAVTVQGNPVQAMYTAFTAIDPKRRAELLERMTRWHERRLADEILSMGKQA